MFTKPPAEHASDRADAYVVIPPHWPPVTFNTGPWAKFTDGEHSKNTPAGCPAVRAGSASRPSGGAGRGSRAGPSRRHLCQVGLLLGGGQVGLDVANATALTLILNWHTPSRASCRPVTPPVLYEQPRSVCVCSPEAKGAVACRAARRWYRVRPPVSSSAQGRCLVADSRMPVPPSKAGLCRQLRPAAPTRFAATAGSTESGTEARAESRVERVLTSRCTLDAIGDCRIDESNQRRRSARSRGSRVNGCAVADACPESGARACPRLCCARARRSAPTPPGVATGSWLAAAARCCRCAAVGL